MFLPDKIPLTEHNIKQVILVCQSYICCKVRIPGRGLLKEQYEITSRLILTNSFVVDHSSDFNGPIIVSKILNVVPRIFKLLCLDVITIMIIEICIKNNNYLIPYQHCLQLYKTLSKMTDFHPKRRRRRQANH